MGRFVPKAVVAAAAAGLTIPFFALSASAATPPPSRVTLPGSAPSWASPANDAGLLTASTAIEAQVYLAPNGGAAALDAAVDAVSTPGTAAYRHFLTESQYVTQFGPSSAQIAAVSSWLTGAGLTVTGRGPGNRYVAVTGTAAAAQRAFGVTLHSYRHNGTTEQAPSTDLTVPSNLASQVLGVVGLSSPQMATHDSTPDAQPPAGFANARPCSAYYGQIQAKYEGDYTTRLPKFEGATLDYAVCGYTPTQFRSAYGVSDTSMTGSGVTVAITDAYASPKIRTDANTYATRHGDAAFNGAQYAESGPSGSYRFQGQCGPSGWYGEETLDVEAVHGMATNADVRYYPSRSCFDVDFLETLQRVVDENVASYVTNSWGEPSSDESAGTINAYEQVFKQAAMQGIGVLFSSGDSGDDVGSTGLLQTDYPASDPWVTAVGGTSTAIGSDGSLSGEAGWGTDKYTLSEDGTSWVPIADNPFLYGAGGGYSSLFNRPSYQRGVVPASAPPGRAVPDIAMDADPTTGMLIGETQTFPDGVHYGEYRIGGTSLASPLMAGMQALASESSGGRFGFLNPRIYRLARTGADVYTDVDGSFAPRGNVRPDFVDGVDPHDGIVYSVRTFGDDASLAAVPGWDDVTGVGSPKAEYLTAAATN